MTVSIHFCVTKIVYSFNLHMHIDLTQNFTKVLTVSDYHSLSSTTTETVIKFKSVRLCYSIFGKKTMYFFIIIFNLFRRALYKLYKTFQLARINSNYTVKLCRVIIRCYPSNDFMHDNPKK